MSDQPEPLPIPEAPQNRRIPDDQQPDARYLDTEAWLLDQPGVRAASLSGDSWLVALEAGAPIPDLPPRIDGRILVIEQP